MFRNLFVGISLVMVGASIFWLCLGDKEAEATSAEKRKLSAYQETPKNSPPTASHAKDIHHAPVALENDERNAPKDVATKQDESEDWEADWQNLPPAEQKYARAILSFREAVGKVSPEDLAREQKQLEGLLAKAQSEPMPEPQITTDIDEFGNTWIKKTYPHGVIRYEFTS
jgi:hypothetical protein